VRAYAGVASERLDFLLGKGSCEAAEGGEHGVGVGSKGADSSVEALAGLHLDNVRAIDDLGGFGGQERSSLRGSGSSQRQSSKESGSAHLDGQEIARYQTEYEKMSDCWDGWDQNLLRTGSA
jgi:hypothetical protein